MMHDIANMTGRVTNPEYAQQGINALKDAGIKSKARSGNMVTDLLIDIKDQRKKMNDDASANDADDAIKQIKEAK
jgi:aminopeptidase N